METLFIVLGEMSRWCYTGLNVLTGEAAQVMKNYVDRVGGNIEQQSSFSEVQLLNLMHEGRV